MDGGHWCWTEEDAELRTHSLSTQEEVSPGYRVRPCKKINGETDRGDAERTGSREPLRNTRKRPRLGRGTPERWLDS